MVDSRTISVMMSCIPVSDNVVEFANGTYLHVREPSPPICKTVHQVQLFSCWIYDAENPMMGFSAMYR